MACGHIDFDWPVVKAIGNLGSLVSGVWCEKCGEFQSVWRDAKPAEVVGIEILPLPDECPF